MKTKFKNKLRYVAAGIFMLGLVANVSLSLTDPFVHVGADLLAQTSSSSISDSCNGCPPGFACVDGVCVQKEKATRTSCNTSEYCGIFVGYKPCPGHQQSCNVDSTGVTNCSGYACRCDQSPC